MSLALLLGPQLTAFRRAGFDVIGVSAPGPYVPELETAGIRHVPLRHATRSMAPGHDLAALAELVRLFRRLRPAIVHTHNPKPGLYGRVAARIARVPVVVNTVHGLYAVPNDRFAKRAVVYSLERIAASCSDAELVQNPEDMDTLARLGVPRSRLHLLGNGIDLARFGAGRLPPAQVAQLRGEMDAGPNDVVCGIVGRLVSEKGYAEVFAAAAALRSRRPDVRMVVVGPADPEKADGIDSQAIRQAEAAGVRFLGLRHDVDQLYQAFDLYLLASHREGFPRSAMEAAATGLPVVATDIRGCRQVVDHGRTGYLVPLGDVDAIVAAIEEIAGSAELRGRMGCAARHKAESEFDQQVVIDVTIATYRRLMALTTGGRAAS